MSSQVSLQNKDICIGELNLRLANIQTLLQVGELADLTSYVSIPSPMHGRCSKMRVKPDT